jgi:serine/threonine protein kinase
MRSPHLIAIEHVNTIGDALFYVLPLADGGPSSVPTDPEWIPDTLVSRIEARKSAPEWFSSREILEDFLPITRVVAEMNSAGVVHRDIKPANILFFGGSPCLADIGLLDDDTPSLTARGTPGHVPAMKPVWSTIKKNPIADLVLFSKRAECVICSPRIPPRLAGRGPGVPTPVWFVLPVNSVEWA